MDQKREQAKKRPRPRHCTLWSEGDGPTARIGYGFHRCSWHDDLFQGGMLMNKRCTNSSCRKTFSTLNYGGQCPFCGKAYPQLESARKNGRDLFSQQPSLVRIMICQKDESRKGRVSIVMRLKNVLFFCRKGEKIRAIGALLDEGKSHGYLFSLKGARAFVEAILSNRQPCTLWRLKGEKRGWEGKILRKMIKPVFDEGSTR